MIELQHLIIGYGAKAVLSDLNLKLEAGQMACLLGSNGVGKSTLLRTLAGFLPPISGKMLFDGRDISSFPLSQRSRTVSVVLTERVEVPYMKVRDLIGMGRAPYTGFFGTLSKEDEVIVEEALNMVGIADLAERAINTLSDGERQKAMIAKALAQGTPIILLDEPTAFLDFHAKVSTLKIMQRLAHKMGKTILMSTHDVEMAIQLSDMLWIVEDGHITAGTSSSLTSDGTLERFLGWGGIVYNAMQQTLIIT